MEWLFHKTHNLSSKCHCFLIFQTNIMVLLIIVGLTFIWNKLVLLLPMTDLENSCKTAGSLQENKALCQVGHCCQEELLPNVLIQKVKNIILHYGLFIYLTLWTQHGKQPLKSQSSNSAFVPACHQWQTLFSFFFSKLPRKIQQNTPRNQALFKKQNIIKFLQQRIRKCSFSLTVDL